MAYRKKSCEHFWTLTFKKVEDPSYIYTVTFKVVDKWVDLKGNIYLTILYYDPGPRYELNKISNTGTVLEYVVGFGDCPTEIDPNDLNYRIYYRQ